jgi:hypothetical protein
MREALLALLLCVPAFAQPPAQAAPQTVDIPSGKLDLKAFFWKPAMSSDSTTPMRNLDLVFLYCVLNQRDLILVCFHNPPRKSDRTDEKQSSCQLNSPEGGIAFSPGRKPWEGATRNPSPGGATHREAVVTPEADIHQRGYRKAEPCGALTPDS